MAENTSCQISEANGWNLAISSFIWKEVASSTAIPKNQQWGNYTIAHKTWKANMDFYENKGQQVINPEE